jgi:hypothetical protein
MRTFDIHLVQKSGDFAGIPSMAVQVEGVTERRVRLMRRMYPLAGWIFVL